jgi:predicted dehydrogenase
MSKLRFAQAGVKEIHAGMYRDTLMLMSDEVELVGFYDPNPGAVRASLKPDVQDVPFFGSIQEMIEQTQPDAVLVSALNRDAPEMMLAVAEAGVHLWGEKPGAAHSSQLMPVAAAMERNNLQFSCGYSWRFHPLSQLIKQTVEAGLLGKLYSIDFRFLTSSVKRRGPDNWAFKREISGGGILNWLGCHWFDLMRYLTDAEVTRVSALEANVGGEAVDIEDVASVSLQFSNGMIGSLHAGFLTPGDTSISMGLRGSAGWVSWDESDNACTIKSVHPDWVTAPVRTFNVPLASISGYGPEGLALMRAFTAAIRGEGSSSYSIQDMIQVLQIAEAAHESARTGQTVTLPGG